MPDVSCLVCRRREPTSGHVCDTDQKRIAEQLIDLPRMLAALPMLAVPGQADHGERVSTSRVGSPAPARVDVLSLAGPGSVYVEGVLRPLRRHWKTERVVSVSTVVGAGELRVEEKTVVDWHQEFVRDDAGNIIAGSDDDQTGILPPSEWLDSWVRNWRVHFGHAVPSRTWGLAAPGTSRDQVEQAMLGVNPHQSPAIAAMVAKWRQLAARIVLGLDTHDRSDDPLADEWEIRFGEARRSQAVYHDIHYLLTWLSEACEQNVGIAEFAAELGAVTAELARVLGETPDRQWLGRCPATIAEPAPYDPETPERVETVTRICGSGLWQDPYASQVACPRCHSTWGPKKVELLRLRQEIRRRWPIDRQLRYTADDINDLETTGRFPMCPTCRNRTTVTWREVTAPGDKERYWRPAAVKCPQGCAEAERVL